MKAVSKLLLVIVTSSLLISTSTSVSTPSGCYDPWMDLDDDGDIDLSDIVAMAGIYGSVGDPFTAKASVAYDSDWINCTDLRGQFFDICHNLGLSNWNNENVMIEVIGKTDLQTSTLHRQLGITLQSQWERAYGGTGTEHARCVVQTEDGGYAIAGYTVSFGAGTGDFWLVKTDASGNLQWSKTYGGPNTDVGWSVVQTEDGGYAIAGFTWSFGVGGRFPDIWLVKTDALGNHQWNHTYGRIDGDVGHSVVQTKDGGYAIAGYRVYFGSADMDVWLVKTDPLGNHEWNHTYGGRNSDGGHSVVQTKDGGYAIAGYTYAHMAETSDMWLMKTDAFGNHQWNHTYGGADNDAGYSLVQTEDDGYAIAGDTWSFDAGSGDVWLVKAFEPGYEPMIKVEYGLSWTASTQNTITLYRGEDDPQWNYVRVRIWKIKDTP